MKICGIRRDRNQWSNRYCAGSGAGSDTLSGSQHPAPHAKPGPGTRRVTGRGAGLEQLEARNRSRVCLLVGCLTSQQHASVSQGRICSDNLTCCHTEIEVADPTFYLTQSQYTDTGPTSPSADPRTPGAWQGSHWNANF